MRARVSRLGDHIEHQRSAVGRMTRLGDVMVACTLLVITLPLMLIVALAIKGESLGPILNSHTCVSADGTHFRILRFRTAAQDPELAAPSWAQTRTRIGRFLWSTRIDALPQLINVLRGEISLIDPSRSPSFLN
jgi:lipopolysaccharide/colanic/teichoic acid biosynthesis glycosyltransferase